MISKTTYSEGVNVGYRWFDKENIEPLFPSATQATFEYSACEIKKSSDGGLDVSLTIKNSGAMELRRSAAGLSQRAFGGT